MATLLDSPGLAAVALLAIVDFLHDIVRANSVLPNLIIEPYESTQEPEEQEQTTCKVLSTTADIRIKPHTTTPGFRDSLGFRVSGLRSAGAKGFPSFTSLGAVSGFWGFGGSVKATEENPSFAGTRKPLNPKDL